MRTHQTLMLAFALVSLSIMNGCQKEPQSVDSAEQADEMAYTPKAAKLVADINSFKQKNDSCARKPTFKKRRSDKQGRRPLEPGNPV